MRETERETEVLGARNLIYTLKSPIGNGSTTSPLPPQWPSQIMEQQYTAEGLKAVNIQIKVQDTDLTPLPRRDLGHSMIESLPLAQER